MVSHSDYKWINNVIPQIAKRILRTYSNTYLDQEDLIQEGWLSLINASSNNKNLTNLPRPYIYAIIVRSIRQASLQSISILKSSYEVKRTAFNIYIRLKNGENLSSILKDLKISNNQWDSIKGLLKKHELLSKIKHPTINFCLDSQFILKDILSIPTLTKMEREIILAKINNKQSSLKISRTTMWKHLGNIKKKLRESGYFA
jgi:DNA-directed RNA polymerase specialized sigma subunit